jgi:hypothetical protein
MLSVTFISALAASDYGALELNPYNWDKEVKESGKAAFIKFLAPW